MWHDILVGISNNLQLSHIAVAFIGAFAGLVIGALPGLSAVSGVALMLPFTFSMDPAMGLIMLASVYMSAEYGGSISAILINTPGTSGAACTMLDGTPMTKKGEAQEALYISLLAGTFGGLFGALVLLLLTKPLAQVSLLLGPAEMFWMAVAGLALVASLTSGNVLKGLIGVVIGVGITLVGQDSVTGEMRYTFNDYRLVPGIPFVPALLGLFAVASIFALLEEPSRAVAPLKMRKGALREVIARLSQMKILLTWTSVLGTLVGIMPGAGAAVSAFVAYSEAKRISKHPEEFGKGSWEGVAAPECSNNAVVGGSLVPLLALGIPGSGSAAIMFGALAVHGIIPGPRLFIERGELAYTFMIGIFTTIIAMLVLGLVTIRWSSLIVKTPRTFLIPAVLALSLIGSYGLSNSVFDVYTLVAAGLAAYFLSKLNVPVVTIALGLVLGRLTEESFQQSLLIANVDSGSLFWFFVSRPLSLLLMALAGLILVAGFVQMRKDRLAAAAVVPAAVSTVSTGGISFRDGDIALGAVLIALSAYGVYEALGMAVQAAYFPFVTCGTLIALGALLIVNALQHGGRLAAQRPFADVPWPNLLASMAALVICTLAVTGIGFFEASFAFLLFVYVLLSRDDEVKRSLTARIMTGVLFAAGFTTFLYVMFHLVLGIPTPAGLLL